MSSQAAPPRRGSLQQKRPPSTARKSVSLENGNGTTTTTTNTTLPKPPSPPPLNGTEERTVKKLRLSKALTIPEGTTVSDACRRMAARRVDAVLLTDANALLSGILTDKDIAARVIAEGLRPDQTLVAKIMTRNPIFVTADSLAMEALQKMVQGKFRHLPVVENGEVIALLDITKCLYDAISRMEKAAEQGNALAAAVEGVERQWGSDFSAPYAFIETLRDRMFKPSLATIVGESTKVGLVSPSDPVYVAAKKMRELRVNSVIIVLANKIQGILTSKDILMRVVAQNLSPELTLVEKVMTPHPECATLETTILDALHTMHDGKFLHLPVVDKDGNVAACIDVLQITHAAISMVENGSGAVNDMASTMMQKFWDSALALEPPDDYDTQSEVSALMASDGADLAKSSYPSLCLGNTFAFKFQDLKGRVHRLNFGIESLSELVSAILQRIGVDNAEDRPQILYEDDEGDKVLISTDSDLMAAVNHARTLGVKVLRLHLDYSDLHPYSAGQAQEMASKKETSVWTSVHTSVLAGAIILSGMGIMDDRITTKGCVDQRQPPSSPIPQTGKEKVILQIIKESGADPEKLRSDLISLKQLYGLLLCRTRETASPMHLDDRAWMMLKDLLNDAATRLLEDHSQMAAATQSSSIPPTKVFSMSVEEENSRKKLQRIHSPDISSAVPVLVPCLSYPSNVFTFTATKNELSGAGSTSRARCEHSKPPTEATRHEISSMRCWVCKRPRITKAVSRTGYEPLSGGKLWPPSRDDDGKQANSFSIGSINSTKSEPSSLLLKFADNIANSKSKEGLQPKCTAELTAVACHNSAATPALPSFYQNCADKKLEDTDQIVKEASQMVKLLESRNATLQQSTQALEPPSERKIAMRAMNSCSASKKEETLNKFLHARKELKGTSMLQQPPLDQSSREADRPCRQSPNFLNLRAVTTFPIEASSPAPSPSRRQSAAPSQSHKSSLAPPNQILVPSPKQGSGKSQKLSRIPNQKSRPRLSLNNTVQRLQSLRVTSSPNRAPKYVNGFIVSPAPTQSKLEKENMHRAPAAHAGSTSSGASRPSKPSNTQSQTRMLESTQKARNPTSKLMRSHKILSRQQSSSDYNAHSGSSVSSSSSSWTTTQQSRPTRSDEYSYSSGSLTSRTESSVSLDYSNEARRSSETSQSSQRRPSRAPSFNRRRRKENRSPKEEPVSRLRRIKNKLGLIFHHHHHDVEKPKSKWKNMRQKMVREQAAKKASESAAKSSVVVEKGRNQQGHFHALLDGLIGHIRLRKKKKKEKPKEMGRRKKKVKWWKHRRRLKLPVTNKKTKIKAVKKLRV